MKKDKMIMSEKLRGVRVKYFAEWLNDKTLTDIISEIQKTKKEYKKLIKKIVIVLKDRDFIHFYDPSELEGLKFIDFYTKIQNQWKTPEMAIINKLDGKGVNKIIEDMDKLISELSEKLNVFYNETLDRYQLKLILYYKKIHNLCMDHLNSINKLLNDQRDFIKEKSKEAMDEIGRIIS